MAQQQTLTLSMLEPDIAVLTFDQPGTSANVLSRDVLGELETHLNTLDERSDLAGLILRSAKPGMFIAGADIREFLAGLGAPRDEIIQMAQRGQQLFGRLARCNYVTVAAIDGVCVGGGSEMSMWCDRRIMTTGRKTQYGFPEVKLGLFPGWGGTSRMPRMIGLSNAVELIAGGESIDGKAAYKLGLASNVVEPEQLEAAAVREIRAEQESGQYRTDRERWAGPLPIGETELAYLGATASAYIQQQTKGHYPAPLAALEVMMEACSAGIDEACRIEAEGFADLFGTPINRALINVFFLTDRNKKDKGIDADGVEARKIGSVAVIGAGIMGQGIAAANVKRKIPVVLADASSDALTTGVQKVLEEVSYNRAIKGPDAERAVAFAPLIRGTATDAELAGSDLVIEAVVENPQVKKELFARLEPQLGGQTILASNTSTIPIEKMAEGLAHPERFCGIHFFNPVRKMPLVEVIRGPKTDARTVATAVAFAKALGKSPIVVQDGPGFLVNRLLLPYMNEALELVLAGAELNQVDRVAKQFGMPMGPITLFDVVGIDTAMHAGRVMYEAFPDRVVASELLTAFFKAGRLGQKSGAGFFAYGGKSSRGSADPDADKLIKERRRGDESFTAELITQRLFLPMIVEATRVLEDKIVRNVRDVDLGLIFGIGFPPFKGGLLFWADTIGADKVVEQLKPFESLGKRFEPTEMLLEMARSGGKFYQ
ncbi:MAG: fatty acid oxidation complex subunit alpha FadB [Planctomycetia bacterium]|nr:MAG: fatty acid oxidation complex subunit alpha FadB [Planctomycetia bacterium]